MSLFFKAPLDIEIRLEDEKSRKHIELKSKQGRIESFPLFRDGESVKGQVTLRSRGGKVVEHIGVKVQLLGVIESPLDTITSSEFLSLATELAAPGHLNQSDTYGFAFRNVEKQYESYRGKNVNLRYFIRVVVSRKNKADITREKDLWVLQYANSSNDDTNGNAPGGRKSSTGSANGEVTETNAAKSIASSAVKMDVGIEHCLHIEFEYNKSRFSLKDVIMGRIFFLLVRIKIKHMEVSIVRRETVGSGPSSVLESETMVRFEIMDGAPVKGESIPIRLFLNGYDLTPTYKDVNKKFSCRSYLQLVLIDEDGRRYFKQSEITLFRDE
ncbi:hypothetical protein FT663_04043 [Candidozyma haemuli var. vulneris]|uniref:Vacuolar protein sorting-associated protein 26 n=1 Tax=Candidozyma haemuli TaxID=45357 RepID=A0A2V1AQK6_9ASCO|nr:hypothetical protein CXQ85_003359 [[Candida] haemuloni]KAF3987222.1 hypothetical protein FT662_04124 [[Candida] haemuloni var. vulneris]KAF3988431.1 hypothetical protein FT663_04043 [[Candida] haemuloni var. vulneris]PVH19513.1 hypothetical protein CXQ85_003359 [[Candida] haemuloni]